MVLLVEGQNDVKWDAGINITPTEMDDTDEPAKNNAIYLPMIVRK